MTLPVRIFVLLSLLVLTSCAGVGPGASGPSAIQATNPSATTERTGQSIPQVIIQSPLQIDGEDGYLYAMAQVNGRPKLAVLDARDGRLLQAWEATGRLALDPVRDRLIVDMGTPGVTILNSATGETLAAVGLPPQENPPLPQVDEKSGLVYAFREATILVIDPVIQSIIRSVPLNISTTVCDSPSGNAPIVDTAYNDEAGHLYLTFITATCAPWAIATVIVFEAANMTEIGRFDIDPNHQFASFDDRLYGLSVSRLGPTLYWMWDAESQWLEQSDDYHGPPRGMAVDTGRKLVYEAYGEIIRIVDPRTQSVVNQMSVPLLSEARLAGHDATSDTLYFVSPTGRLYLWPANNLTGEQSPPVSAASPFPIAPIRSIALPGNWMSEQTMAALIDNGDCPTDGGRLFLMTDPDDGWIESTVGTDGACDAVAVVSFSPAYANDSLIFAAANQPATILRSVDAGRSWTAAEIAFPTGTTFSALLPSPAYASDQTLYALTTAGLLYRSRDGGRAWRLLDQRLDQVTVAGGAGPALQLFGSYGDRVLRSNLSGDEWVTVGTTPSNEPLELLAAAPSIGDAPILYAFTTGGRFARSLDGGVSWVPVMETAPAAARLVIASDMPEETRPVFLLHNESVDSSYNGMASIWSDTVSTEASRYRPTAFAASPDFAAAPYLFVGTADGQIIRLWAGITP